MTSTAHRLDLHSLLHSGDLWLGDRRVCSPAAVAAVENLGRTDLDSSLPPYSFGIPRINHVLKSRSLHELCLENRYTKKSSGLWHPPLFAICQILKTTAAAQRTELSLQANSLLCAWVGRKSWPTIQLLDSFLEQEWRKRCLFIAPEDRESRLWTAIQVLRSGCFSSVVVDGTRFDFAGTRRLQLAAREGGSIVLMVRPPWELEERSAAVTRWLFTPLPTTAGGAIVTSAENSRPLWKLSLKRARGAREEQSWDLELRTRGLGER